MIHRNSCWVIVWFDFYISHWKRILSSSISNCIKWLTYRMICKHRELCHSVHRLELEGGLKRKVKAVVIIVSAIKYKHDQWCEPWQKIVTNIKSNCQSNSYNHVASTKHIFPATVVCTWSNKGILWELIRQSLPCTVCTIAFWLNVCSWLGLILVISFCCRGGLLFGERRYKIWLADLHYLEVWHRRWRRNITFKQKFLGLQEQLHLIYFSIRFAGRK